MRFASVCSGIEAASVAWHPLGWKAAWFSEIEKFPCALLAHHYPETPNLGDMMAITEEKLNELGTVDVLVGGTPCQSFSVAGLRGGLDDARGNLALRFIQLASVMRPRWVVWENVPGVLSSGGGRDFGSIVGALEKCGYGWAYRILDAQYFGVAQRRRRVFIVGYLGDWRRAAAVLFERASLCGDIAPGRATREDAAKCITSSSGNGGGFDLETETAVVGTLTDFCGNNINEIGTHPLTRRYDSSEDGCGRGTPLVPCFPIDTQNMTEGHASGGLGFGHEGDPAFTVTKGHSHAVAFDMAQITSKTNGTRVESGLPASTINTAGQMHAAYGTCVRRLTPRECERLQGFPDDYTLIPFRGKPASDGPRYRALGNSMAVPVMRWIGERIEMVDKLQSRTLEGQKL